MNFNNKGITMVSMVVTIAIIIILAGVTVNLAVNQTTVDKAKITELYEKRTVIQQQLKLKINDFVKEKDYTKVIAVGNGTTGKVSLNDGTTKKVYKLDKTKCEDYEIEIENECNGANWYIDSDKNAYLVYEENTEIPKWIKGENVAEGQVTTNDILDQFVKIRQKIYGEDIQEENPANFNYEFINGKAYIKEYNPKEGEVKATIKLPQKCVDENGREYEIVGFCNNNNQSFINSRDILKITEIIIPDGYTVVANKTFYNCTNLKNVYLPDTLTKIGENAFEQCTNLETISLPNNLKKIENGTFYNCPNLKNVSLPNNLTELGENAFKMCTSLEEITFPDNLTTIGEGAFMQCSLNTVTFPKNIKHIGDFAFARNGNVKQEKLELPDETQEIGEGTFEAWTFNEVIIPESVVEIGNNAFQFGKINKLIIPQKLLKEKNLQDLIADNKYTIKEIQLTGSGLSEIRSGMFNNYSCLEKVTIAEGVEIIRANAFSNCPNIKRIVIPASVKTIENNELPTWNNPVIVFLGGQEQLNKFCSKFGSGAIGKLTDN